ncbi:MAG: DnaJ domain-containing protein [Methylomicrobium sp.]|nr:DnaJ domain-containing protein [Methylomicrobium sp.]
MSNYRTHYDNLKVARNAPDAVIRAAYKALMQKYHPDKFEGTEQEALRIAKIIKQSFDALIDPVKRAEHDRWIDEKEAEAKHASNNKAQFDETANAAEQQFYQSADHNAPPRGAANSEINTYRSIWQWFVALMMIAFTLVLFPVQKANVNNKLNKDGAIKSLLKWIFVLILVAFVLGSKFLQILSLLEHRY